MFQLLEDLKKSGDTSLSLQDEKFVLIVDLLLFSPQLELEVIRFVLTGSDWYFSGSDQI